MLKNIKGAIFDMDGTLIDSLMFWDILWDKFGTKFLDGECFKPEAVDDKAIRTMTLKNAMNHLHSVYGIGSSGEELFCVANDAMRNFYAYEVKLKAGVLEFLEYCYAKGIKMCIASATDVELLKVVIERCGIGKYFEGILSCAEIGKNKDQPDIYLKALDLLGTNIEDTCVFEDSYVAVTTADKIGIKTVGIYDRYNSGQEEIKKIATLYVSEAETLTKLIDNDLI